MSRKAGTQNKLTVDMKDMLHHAFVSAGGVKYLVRQAEAEPKAFMALLGRLVPAEVRLDVAVALNLGHEMQIAADNLARLNRHNEMRTIEAVPHVDLERDDMARETVKPLKTNDC